jgi:simple sugar transport system permease protein
MTAVPAAPTPAPAWRWKETLNAARRPLGTLAVLIVMMLIFAAANPSAFGRWSTYNSVLVTVPILIFLVVPLTFVVVAGEVDLSFPSTMGVAAWVFALILEFGHNPLLGFAAAIVVGVATGYAIGLLVVRFGLSALVATLGMNFMLRGIINIGSEGHAIAVAEVRESTLATIMTGRLFNVPGQVWWALIFTIFSTFLFFRHKFGVRVQCVGDNPDSAAQMGIPVDHVRIQTFAFMGFGAALAGVFSVMINFVWWPTAGDGYLLPAIAAVFVGGTPTWGGVGTIVGSALGAILVSFIEIGVVAAGMAGFYVQFFNGLVIVLALIGHRLHSKRIR